MNPQDKPLLLTGALAWCRRLQVMTVKELLQLARDPVLLALILYGFTLNVYLAGSGAFSPQLKNATLVIRDSDQSLASRELIHRFHEPEFRLVGEVSSGRQSTAMLDRGEAMIVLDIPLRFEESLLRGEPASVQLQVDANNPVLGYLAASYGARIVGEFGRDFAEKHNRPGVGSLRTIPVIRDEQRVWYNPNQLDPWFTCIGELLEMITVLAMMLPAAAVVREKERGTIEQLMVSPLTPFQILFPKVLAMTAVIVVGTALSLFAVLHLAFDVPFRGSLPLFFAVTVLYVFTTAGIGLLISTVARNLGQVGLLTILLFLPMNLLSGMWTPPEAMPVWVRLLMHASPLYYYIEVSYGILLKGVGLEVLWDSVLSIGLLGGVVFGVGLWRFRRQFG